MTDLEELQRLADKRILMKVMFEIHFEALKIRCQTSELKMKKDDGEFKRGCR